MEHIEKEIKLIAKDRDRKAQGVRAQGEESIKEV
jgi:hypothetical protein